MVRLVGRLPAVFALLAAFVLSACGGDGAASGSRVVISAASSLEPAFGAYAQRTGLDAKQSFAGSDTLAAQIRQGVRPDLYAAANTSLPEQLYREGLVSKPIVFATNSLVLAVPGDSKITSLHEVAGQGVTVAIGDQGVPVGNYTREILDRLPASESSAILDNVRSQEPDVAGIVGKLSEGAVDAGFVYVTDVEAAAGRLRAIELPSKLQPDVAYAIVTVKGASNPTAARAFVAGLLSRQGRGALRSAGFGPAPG